MKELMAEISKIPGPKKTTAKGWLHICCPWHADRSPSFGINIGDSRYRLGSGNCWGCGKKASWKMIAEKFGLKKLQQSQIDAGRQLNFTSNSWASEAKIENRVGAHNLILPIMGTWRSIRMRTLNLVNAVEVVDPNQEIKFVFLPVIYDDELVGGVKCYSPEDRTLKYVNTEGTWSKKYMFPVPAIEEMLDTGKYKAVAVVEGARDALKWIQSGIPALANNGGPTVWSKSKCNFLLSLGVDIVLALDGDPTGVILTKLMKTDLRAGGGRVKVINMTKWSKAAGQKVDPGNAPRELRDRVKAMCLK